MHILLNIIIIMKMYLTSFGYNGIMLAWNRYYFYMVSNCVIWCITKTKSNRSFRNWKCQLYDKTWLYPLQVMLISMERRAMKKVGQVFENSKLLSVNWRKCRKYIDAYLKLLVKKLYILCRNWTLDMKPLHRPNSQIFTLTSNILSHHSSELLSRG